MYSESGHWECNGFYAGSNLYRLLQTSTHLVQTECEFRFDTVMTSLDQLTKAAANVESSVGVGCIQRRSQVTPHNTLGMPTELPPSMVVYRRASNWYADSSVWSLLAFRISNRSTLSMPSEQPINLGTAPCPRRNQRNSIKRRGTLSNMVATGPLKAVPVRKQRHRLSLLFG